MIRETSWLFTQEQHLVVLMLNIWQFLHVQYLVAKANSQLAEGHRVGTVGSEKHLQLDGLVNMETGRLELCLTLDWNQEERLVKYTCSQNVHNDLFFVESALTEWNVVLHFYRELIRSR